MRIAVTGRHGQLALSLQERAAADAGITLICLGRPDLDLSRPGTIAPALAACQADLVINAAAYTAVDAAESDAEAAFAVNATGAGAVASAAAGLGLPVIQISTDYVFDGSAGAPYCETAPTNPVSVYGASKLAGEAAVAAANPRHLIIRTAWVYSPFGANFVKTMLRLAGERDTLRVVDDQIGNPTSALDLADGMLAAARTVLQPGFDRWGVYNIAGSGSTSWAGFAAHVLAESGRAGGPSARVEPIPGSDYVTAATRPSNSRLDCARAETIFGYRAPDWRQSSAEVVRRLLTKV
ncbi:dTDP-4-dehydrorhamnose reductase [Hoeflea ulvae]|uniref:dTDP-4-dehydrorhamnose reductase n=1 Tax=Hoeflea ulvae TaxID=2983764 RepID=A0ABT3YKF5_9HYPH|nr:dTDP-4-dehydrorhamnose reductase [Hoeflea ulvae]MCY0096383.1 dTDP-4-dehydrorhamnose reductase [Hoeflea ulvae]